jgi:hypothetical protein
MFRPGSLFTLLVAIANVLVQELCRQHFVMLFFLNILCTIVCRRCCFHVAMVSWFVDIA